MLNTKTAVAAAITAATLTFAIVAATKPIRATNIIIVEPGQHVQVRPDFKRPISDRLLDPPLVTDVKAHLASPDVTSSSNTPSLPSPDMSKQELTEYISNSYKVPNSIANKIVSAAYEHSNEVFTPEDILSIVAIESSFDHTAKSKLKKDPAVGLMQFRPGIWKHIVDKSRIHQIGHQVEVGTTILNDYYNQLGSKKAAIQAYNVGITAYKKGKRANGYFNKYVTEKRTILKKVQL